MRRTLTPLLVFLVTVLSTAQTKPTLAAISEEVTETDVFLSSKSMDLVSFSEGFTDSTFHHHQLLMSVSSEQYLSMETDFPKTLQYSVSNVEGIILRKGKFYQQGMVNIANLKQGSYAIYFFAGKRIVRALMFERNQASL